MSQSIAGMIARGVVALANAGRKLQTLQLRVTAGAVKDGVEHFEPYGFTSCPKDGAEALVAFLGDDWSHGVTFVVSDRRFRLQELKPGEVALYTDEGDALVFKRGQVVELKTKTFRVEASERIDLVSPIVEASKELIAQGRLSANQGMSVAAGESGAAAAFAAPIQAPDAVIAGKSVAGHRHAETGSITEPMQ
ncbi:phage baseplate assembly protein V [Ralstonia pseudosolanacearum]|uniref:phage baseplate assembly protein V n=1 Tax=Ralstonia pseudosolanacearum TaxID=1310165 RepID=UPI003CE73770